MQYYNYKNNNTSFKTSPKASPRGSSPKASHPKASVTAAAATQVKRDLVEMIIQSDSMFEPVRAKPGTTIWCTGCELQLPKTSFSKRERKEQLPFCND
ncbi:hypothetical protein MUCCIDRAFT_112244 [Mucor lusitanicus CBS 277.49]|uniref:Uncharacterized protein n=1 Tax=Mucor lusitanicus CBS 277.49 TaxID=747725 RepID=A0A168J722_MUCCL|nr:hypothetical protein MUCCIDRAFT_112244 [Mucor lusitanicus CBS 277.49]